MKRAFLVISLLMMIVTPPTNTAHRSISNHIPAATGITLTIDFGNGTELIYPKVEEQTVLDATENVTSVDVDWYGDRAFVISIAGVANDAESGLWWQYWVNGELGSVAANKYQLDNNDTVTWRRIPPTYSTPTQNNNDSSTLVALAILPVIGILVISIFHFRRS
ncbi:MAG: DUF4430 domain-containing protein [Candidatus Thorarchaeota archaeon]|nr:DUF4430 domain-containing protein [Candidatus Thorarchaeota archaeon]